MDGWTISILAIGRYDYSSSIDMCLTARALGASEMIFASKRDAKIIRYMSSLEKEWGGKFKISFVKSYKVALDNAVKSKKVYLTRYGMPLSKLTYILNTYKNIMLMVSSVKASSKILHNIADFNVSVTDQPHCASAAIAVFLHNFYRGRELAMHFENAKYKVIPREHGISIEKIERR